MEFFENQERAELSVLEEFGVLQRSQVASWWSAFLGERHHTQVQLFAHKKKRNTFSLFIFVSLLCGRKKALINSRSFDKTLGNKKEFFQI